LIEEKQTTPEIANRRADKRISVSVRVEIMALDGGGHPFTERTFIEDVSNFGCRFSMRGTVQKGDTVSVKPLSPKGDSLTNEKGQLFEVMWVAPNSHSMTVGARLLQGEKLANTKFPPEVTE
jgi:hypothetical protein